MIGCRWVILRALILLGGVFLGLGMFLAILIILSAMDQPVIMGIMYLFYLAVSVIIMLLGIGLMLFAIAWNLTHKHVSEALDEGWRNFVGLER